MDSSQLISHYRQIALLTEQMRAAAEQSEWDRLVDLESHRSHVLADVKPMDAAITLDASGLNSRDDYIRKILSLDVAIHALVQRHLDQVQLNIASDQNTQRLRQAYGV